MIKKIFIFGFLLTIIDSYAQINFKDHNVIDNRYALIQAKSVNSADIDGDGDQDVIYTAGGDFPFGWYENLDGKGVFGKINIIDANVFPGEVYPYDIDNDGYIDLLTSYQDKTISPSLIKVVWYRNIDGKGNFSTKNLITTHNIGRVSYFAGYIDADDKLDVVSSSSTSNYDKIVWNKNIGNGVFSNQSLISSLVDYPYSIYISDIDGDGIQDVVSASVDDDKIAWYKNIGNGVFDSQKIISSNAYGASLVITKDIDKDGDLDIISFTNSNNTIAWYKNINGSGVFEEMNTINTNANQTYSIFVSDLDNDGDEDILVASNSENKCFWHKNLDGLGNFSEELIISKEIYTSRSILATDLDNDGDKDVLLASQFNGEIGWFENTYSDGNFGRLQLISQSIDYPFEICMADFNGDGNIDILSGSLHDSKIAWYDNVNGDGNFELQQRNIKTMVDLISLYPVDIDGDNDIDVLSSSSVLNGNFWTYLITWYENLDGKGNFSDEQIISTDFYSSVSISAGDMDGDGDMDVLSASTSDETGNFGKLEWFENINGQGDSWIKNTIVNNPPVGTHLIKASDIDNDGDMDVIWADKYNNIIAWNINIDGKGNFNISTYNETFEDLGPISTIRVNDLDTDGDLDILYTAPYSSRIGWLENLNGLGNFNTHHIVVVETANGLKSAYETDIDADGDLDIISVSSNYEGKLAYYENLDGKGNFGTSQIVSNTSGTPYRISSGDIDNDGDLDIISCSQFYNKIYWHENSLIDNTLKSKETISSNYQLYPNPASDIIFIKSKLEIHEIIIFNNVGQIVLRQHNNSNIDITSLKSGLYFIKIKDNDHNTMLKKFIKK